MYNKFIAVFILMIVAGSCRRTDQYAVNSAVPGTHGRGTGVMVADTIIYDVIIRNPDPEDAWTAQCLAGLDHPLLVDSVFNMIYSGKMIAYDHNTREKLTPKQVENIESASGFNRGDIGMIQFTEAWYLDPGGAIMTKEVLSMVLGYNYYTPEGERFYKALFRVEMGNYK